MFQKNLKSKIYLLYWLIEKCFSLSPGLTGTSSRKNLHYSLVIVCTLTQNGFFKNANGFSLQLFPTANSLSGMRFAYLEDDFLIFIQRSLISSRSLR